MKLKELESHLQQVTPFTEFNYMLEQYPTSPHLAARMLFTISSVYDDIKGMSVGDFGCGGGMLGLAAAMLGAGSVLGVDVDPKAITLARKNAQDLDLAEVLHCHVEPAQCRWHVGPADPVKITCALTMVLGQETDFLLADLAHVAASYDAAPSARWGDRAACTPFRLHGVQIAEGIFPVAWAAPMPCRSHGADAPVTALLRVHARWMRW
jgi:SAM-dependent methyltransferase